MSSSTTSHHSNKRHGGADASSNPASKRPRRRPWNRDPSTVKGGSGVLVTATRGKERIAGLSLCKAIADVMMDKTGGATTTTITSLDDLVKAEVEAERMAEKKTDAALVELGIDCVALVADVKDPVLAVVTICNQVLNHGQMVTSKFVQRLVPLESICHASVDAIGKAFETHMETFEFSSKPDWSFGIVARIRSTSIAKDDVIKAIAALVDQTKHPVKLDDPDVVICVEVCKGIAGFCVIPNETFKRTCKFNLQELMKKSPVVGGAVVAAADDEAEAE